LGPLKFEALCCWAACTAQNPALYMWMLIWIGMLNLNFVLLILYFKQIIFYTMIFFCLCATDLVCVVTHHNLGLCTLCYKCGRTVEMTLCYNRLLHPTEFARAHTHRYPIIFKITLINKTFQTLNCLISNLHASKMHTVTKKQTGGFAHANSMNAHTYKPKKKAR